MDTPTPNSGTYSKALLTLPSNGEGTSLMLLPGMEATPFGYGGWGMDVIT